MNFTSWSAMNLSTSSALLNIQPPWERARGQDAGSVGASRTARDAMRGQFPEGVPSVSRVLRGARQVPAVLRRALPGSAAPPSGTTVSLGYVASRRELGSWLEPQRPQSGASAAYPGERLGRPADGPRSLASFGRRLVALVVDWVVALLIAGGLL